MEKWDMGDEDQGVGVLTSEKQLTQQTVALEDSV